MCHGDSECLQGCFHQHQRLLLEAEWGADVITRFTESTWWEWTRGSTLVFWRWGDYANLALDGCAPFLLSELPKCKKRTPTPSADKRGLISAKLQTIIDRGYLIHGRMESLIQFFDVPKADDIRLVYNGRSCDLNSVTWAPNFWLPSTRTALRTLDYNYYSIVWI
jgi:hypothetical protein